MMKQQQSTSDKPQLADSNNDNAKKAAQKARTMRTLTTIDELIKAFPKAFFPKEIRPKPLKVNIHTDIIEYFKGEETSFSIKDLKHAIHYYTSRLRYYRACDEGADRIDLNGEAVEKVTTQQAEHAKTQLDQAESRRKKSIDVKKKQYSKPKKPSESKLAALAEKWSK